MLHAHYRSICYRRGVIGDGIFTLQPSKFVLARRFPLREYWMVVDIFCSSNLDLGPMTFIYKLDQYSLESGETSDVQI